MLAQELGAHSTEAYPTERFDLLWVVQNRRFISKESQNCKGLDEGRLDDDEEESGRGFEPEGSQLRLGFRD